MGVCSLSGQEAVEGSLRGRSRGCQCCEQMWRAAEQKAVPLAGCGHSCPGKQIGSTWSGKMKLKKNVLQECLTSDFLGAAACVMNC